jgi:N-methylhydantoinase A/oxoprolinase/acetone carboxylase beta subunit
MTDLEPKLDLLETRRQLMAMRSLHSHNRRVANEINRLIRKIAHLHQPDNPAHEKRLIEMIARTWRAVELIVSHEHLASR